MRLVSVVTSTRSFDSARIVDLAEQVVDLARRRTHLDLGIDQPRRADDLLDHLRPACSSSYGARRRRHVDRLRHRALELLEFQRPVVERGRQAEAVVHQLLLAGAVAAIHAADLRDRHVALVDDQQGIGGKIIEQRRRRLARRPPGEVARVVLDAGAISDLVHHLQVVERALLQALRLEQLARATRSSARRSSSSTLIASMASSMVSRGVT